ncbi:MAG: LysE family translocator [Pseudomonadota bacterium]
MTLDIALALAAFAFVSSITPGPNNLMLMASGANFGFARTMPHMFGVAIGFVVMVVLVGLGLAQLFELYPALGLALKIVSVVYLLYLAWKIATAAPVRATSDVGTPMTFVQAALFQWVNPKAWAMALTAITVYAPSRTVTGVFLVALLFGFVNLPSVGVWVTIGQQVRRFLATPARLRAFNITMAVLLIASLYPVLAP